MFRVTRFMTEEKQHNPEASASWRSDGADKKIFQNPDVLKWIIVGLSGFVIIVLIFGIGVRVGISKARYSYRWTESYHKNFAGPKGGFLGDWRRFPAGDFISGHGAFGEIIEIKDNGFVIKDRENIEKFVVTNQDTTITKGRETIKNGLKVGDCAVIIGSPNDDGQIEAKLIRVLPPRPTGMFFNPPPFRMH